MATSTDLSSSGPPPVPPRHPGRRSGIAPLEMPKNERVSRQQAHSWEHASLLYHSYEWYAAADIFLSLARSITKPLESNLCLLNAALIHARLDDFEAAARLLEEAEPQKETSAITMFVLGHVEFEQGNFEKAEDCLRVALSQLGDIQPLEEFGMDFVLRKSHVNHNLRVLATKNSVFGVMGTMGALPVDYIFEPPKSCTNFLDEDPDTVEMRKLLAEVEDGVPPLTDMSVSSGSNSPVESYKDGEEENMWARVAPEVDNEYSVCIRDSGFPSEEATAEFLAKPKIPPFSRRTSIHRYYLPEDNDDDDLAQGLVRRPSAAQPGPLRRRTNLVPRDARVADNTVGDLSHFIRGLPAQNAKEPRNAEAKSDSVWDMARFFQDGPEPHARSDDIPDDSSSVYSQDLEAIPETVEPRRDELTSDDLLSMAESFNKSPTPTRHPYRSGLGEMLARSRSGVSDELYSTSRPASLVSRNSYQRSTRSETPPQIPTRNSSLRKSYAPSIMSTASKKPQETPFVTKLGDDAPKRSKSTKSTRASKAPSSYAQFFPKALEKRMSKW